MDGELPQSEITALQLYTLLRLVRDEQTRLAERLEALEKETSEWTGMLKSSKALVGLLKAVMFIAAGVAAVASALHTLGLRA